MKKVRVSKILLVSILLVFLSVILFFTFHLRTGLSPDSSYHIEVSKAYSTTLGIPENTPGTYQWRDITRIPYLYYWINGRILNINDGYINEVILLRMLNVIYSFSTVCITYLIGKEVLKGKWKRIFPVFLLTNTLMFVFLSSSINYDNLANLFSVLGIYFFVKFVKSKLEYRYILLMLISLSLGTFTKFTVLPLAFILVLLSAWHIFRNMKELKRVESKRYYFLLIPLIFLLILNISVYGVNIFKYGSLEPECEQILTHEQCLQNGVYYRDNVTRSSLEIEGIGHIFNLILDGERVDPIRYFPHWIWNIVGKIYGIMGDNSLYHDKSMNAVYLFVLSIGLLIGIFKYKKWNILDRYLILTCFFYFFVLFLIQNYNMYLKYDHMFLALQGRYVFPVLPLMYILFSKSIFFVKKKWVRNTILVFLILLFIYGCIPFFVFNVPSHWFTSFS